MKISVFDDDTVSKCGNRVHVNSLFFLGVALSLVSNLHYMKEMEMLLTLITHTEIVSFVSSAHRT